MTRVSVRTLKACLPLLAVLSLPQVLATQQGTAPAEMTPIDNLTAPIALYPDALIAQILQASTDLPAVQQFHGWLQGNASLKGSALQGAAQQAGFAACFIALAPFPQVVQMMVEQPDWTQQLGTAFVTDKSAVFASIQRLRSTAQAMGNLKTTPQQEVVTETTSSGQEVIVIQPANPQVIYVPVYNTETVYVQQAPPASSSSSGDAAAAGLVGFTLGIIIGAAADNDYYYGPYGWRGGSMYDEAWDRREDYWEDRSDYAEERRDDAGEYQDERQGQRQEGQSERQAAAQSTSSERQAAAQSTSSERQATAQSGAAQRESTRQSAAATSSVGSGQRASRSDGSLSYQSGSSARAQSARGQSSRSRSGGSARRR